MEIDALTEHVSSNLRAASRDASLKNKDKNSKDK